jgi:post-segregation antitoxin (ccd killing protein)
MKETNVEPENSESDFSQNHQTAQDWLTENSKAIEEYNRSVELEGVFSDGLRGF